MNAEEVKNIFKAKASAIRKAGIKTQFQVAKLMMATAKSLSPIYSGETINGIQVKKLKNGYQVQSKVSGAFKQNLYANETAPYRQNKRMGVYGKSSGIHWTGTPRFFHLAYLRTRETYASLLESNVKDALRVKT